MYHIKYIKFEHNEETSKLSTPEEVAKYICDNALPYDLSASNLNIVVFSKNTTHMMLAQKMNYLKGYASFILFGYGLRSIAYWTENDGVWTKGL